MPISLIGLLLIGAPALAQVADGGAQMVRAAGMPLEVGELPPGTLTVRLVRGAFVENLRDRTVRIEIGGRVETATTDTEGRAMFRLSPGTAVRALADVDGERLESEPFTLPGTGGVRILLVAGGSAAPASAGGTIRSTAVLPPGHPVIARANPPVAAAARPRSTDTRVAAGILAALTVAVGLLFTHRSLPGRR
jgi:hypothetical protein